MSSQSNPGPETADQLWKSVRNLGTVKGDPCLAAEGVLSNA